MKLLAIDWWRGEEVPPLPKTYFDKVTDPRRQQTQRWRQIAWGYHWVMKQLPKRKGLKVADLGSGGCGLPIWIAGRGHHVTAFDQNLYEYPRPVRFIRADFTQQLPPELSGYDVVVSTGVFHLEGKRQAAMAAAKRLLKRDGLLIIVVDTSRKRVRVKAFKNTFGSPMPKDVPTVKQCQAWWRADPEYQVEAGKQPRGYTALGMVLEA